MDEHISDHPHYVKYKVFCRVRPQARGKHEPNVSHTILDTCGGEKQILSVERRKVSTKNARIEKSEEHDFRYDKVFGMDATQEEVFEKVGVPMIDEFMEGTNGTIFAYGQTGTGKTHTIHGTKNNDGMLPRSFEYLFRDITSNSQNQYEIKVQYVELYNERMYDLLAGIKRDRKPNIKVYLDKDGKKKIAVYPVENMKEALDIYQKAFKSRRTSKTTQNINSSRSHAICTIYLTKISENNEKTMSELNLVDLAGSEQYRHGTTWSKEAQQINLSLFHLKSLLTTLSKRKQNQPIRFSYRNSLLTRVLKDSLSGNSLCAMIATINLDDKNFDQTIYTCRFSGTVATIRNQVNRNVIFDKVPVAPRNAGQQIEKFRDMEREIKEKTETINNLKNELENAQGCLENMKDQQKRQEDELDMAKGYIEEQKLLIEEMRDQLKLQEDKIESLKNNDEEVEKPMEEKRTYESDNDSQTSATSTDVEDIDDCEPIRQRRYTTEEYTPEPIKTIDEPVEKKEVIDDDSYIGYDALYEKLDFLSHKAYQDRIERMSIDPNSGGDFYEHYNRAKDYMDTRFLNALNKSMNDPIGTAKNVWNNAVQKTYKLCSRCGTLFW